VNFVGGVRQFATAGTHCTPPGTDVAAFIDGIESISGSKFVRVDVMAIDPTPLFVLIDQSSQLWIQTHGSVRLVPTANGEQFVAAIASRDARQIVAATRDGKIVVLDAETLQRMYQSPATSQPILDLDISADSQQLMIGHETNNIEVMSRNTSHEINRLGVPADSAAGNLSICSEGGSVRIVAAAAGNRRIELSKGIAHLLLNGGNGSMTSIPLGEANAKVRDAIFSIDGRRVIVISEPNGMPSAKTELVYDGDSGALLDRKQFTLGTADKCIRMSPDERHAALASGDGLLLVDFASGSLVQSYPSAGGSILGIAFSNTGDRLVGYSNDGTLTVIDAASGVYVDQYGAPALAGGAPMPFGFDNSGKLVVIVRPDQTYGWSTLPIPELIATAMAYVPICIAKGERASSYLPPEPPDWCIEQGKIPYNTDDWIKWLDAKHSGDRVPMPGTGAPVSG